MTTGSREDATSAAVRFVFYVICAGLAIRFDQLIRDGVVTDQAELTRLGHVCRARLTQMMNLLCLARDIQEALLFLPATERRRDAITEKQLRPIAAVPDWRKQRKMWNRETHHAN